MSAWGAAWAQAWGSAWGAIFGARREVIRLRSPIATRVTLSSSIEG